MSGDERETCCGFGDRVLNSARWGDRGRWGGISWEGGGFAVDMYIVGRASGILNLAIE